MTEILMIIGANKFKSQNIPSGRACTIICNSIILQIRVLNSRECPQDYEVSSTHPDLESGLLISLVIFFFLSVKQNQNTLHLKKGDTLI